MGGHPSPAPSPRRRSGRPAQSAGQSVLVVCRLAVYRKYRPATARWPMTAMRATSFATNSIAGSSAPWCGSRWRNRWCILPPAFLIEISLGGTISEALQFGASVWLWGVIIRTVLVWHVTWCGNSFPHLFGYRNYETNDNSRNNAWWRSSPVVRDGTTTTTPIPDSASNQRHWWEIDLTYLLLRLLVLLGLAWDVQLPKRAHFAARARAGRACALRGKADNDVRPRPKRSA